MIRNRVLPYSIVLVVLAGLCSGCARGPSEEELQKAELGSQLTVIQADYQTLQQQRTDLAAAEVLLAEIEAVAEKNRTDEQKALLEELGPKIQELTTAKDTSFEAVQEKVADFLNIGLNSFPDSAETAACLEIYAAEAVLVAEDMVVKAGDYKKAIDHLRSANGYFEAVGLPADPKLAAKLEEFEDWRYITQERFDTVKKNMTKEDVIAAVGVPYYGNIQEDSKRGVETWLYRKADGGAAAIYFKMKTNKVYDWKFDAIKTKVVED